MKGTNYMYVYIIYLAHHSKLSITSSGLIYTQAGNSCPGRVPSIFLLRQKCISYRLIFQLLLLLYLFNK